MDIKASVAEDLLRLNRAIHARLEEYWFEAMAAITALDLASGRQHWERFEVGLALHAAAEDANLMPLYTALEAFPRGAAPDIIAHEHRKLEKLSLNGRRAITGITGRRDMIRQLPHLMRPQQLLEHHTMREQSLVYPAAFTAANADERALLRAALEDSLRAVEALFTGPSS